MKINHLTPIMALLAVIITSSATSPVNAQSGGAVQVIVPYAPGGSADIIGRLLGDQLSKQTGRQVVIVNQPGASGELGSTNVARAIPNGNTLLYQTSAVTIALLRKAACPAMKSHTG